MPFDGRKGAPSGAAFTALFAAVLFAFYGGFALLWASPDTHLYDRLMHLWGVNLVHQDAAYAKQPLPFFDLQGVLSWSECSHRGIDVLASNPCDPQNRVMNYAPLIGDLPLHWIGTRNTLPAGLVLDTAFLLMLVAVFQPRTLAGLGLAAAASLSQSVLFAVERANIDIVVFILLAATCLWGTKSHVARYAQYALAIGGGLVKFYPFVILLTALRERPRIVAVLAGVSAAVMATFVFGYWPDLLRLPAVLPPVYYSGDMFGAHILPRLLGQGFGLPAAGVVGSLALAAILFCWFSLHTARRLRSSVGEIDFNARKEALLLCGSILVLGCFLAQSNVAYRASFLLLTLPGLAALWHRARGTHLAPILLSAIVLTLVCLWANTLRFHLLELATRLTENPKPFRTWPLLTFFLLREAMWWYVVAVQAAIVICFARQAPLFKTLAGRSRPVLPQTD